jgi:hypothetical protein
MMRLFGISIPSRAVALVLSETVLVLSCYVVAEDCGEAER